MSEEFLKTAELMKALMLDDQTQLQLYGLYKQATMGDVSIAEPKDFIGKAKYKSWLSNIGKSTEQAEQEYIGLVKSFNATGWGIGVSRPQLEDSIEEEPLNSHESQIKSFCDGIKTGTIDPELLDIVSINCQDRQGMTPLHHSVEEGLVDITSKLIELGANPNIQDSEGMTPLHYAAELDNEEILTILLKAPGVDTNIKDSDGNTIHNIAQKNCAKLV